MEKDSQDTNNSRDKDAHGSIDSEIHSGDRELPWSRVLGVEELRT